MRYVLGLDIGITSVGWALLNLDRRRIEALGTRAFNAAEDPQTKAPLAEPRRLARSARRRLRRRAGRLRRAKELFLKYNLLTEDRLDKAFLTARNKVSPWQLRAEGLDRLLTGEEFARALFHIAKRRGFKSNRKVDRKSKEEGKMLEGIQQNRSILEEKGYRTVGEMFFKDEKFAQRKRNSYGVYLNTVERAMLEDEIRKLFQAQRDLGSKFASPEFEREFLDVFKWQLPFASGDAILEKVGLCTFLGHEGKKRAPKACWTAERFNLLCKINSLTWFEDGEQKRPDDKQRELILEMAYNQKKVTFKQIRNKLGLPESARFTGVTYASRKAGNIEEKLESEGKKDFCQLNGYHTLREELQRKGLWDRVKDNTDLLDELAYACTFYKTPEDVKQYLNERNIDSDIADVVAEMPGFSKVMHLSVEAMKRIIPHLEKGLVYSEACQEAGFNHSNPYPDAKHGLKLPPIDKDEIVNPVVLRALSQARKVVNAITRQWGPPVRVHIELGREIGKSAEERNRINNRIEENRKAREEEKEHFKEIFNGLEPNGEMLLKFRLYREQNGQCAYSQKEINLHRLLEPGYVEIDHILPYSRSYDDSLSNKVLVLCSENREKTDHTPFEWFGQDDKRWANFESWVNANIRDPRKRANLLRRKFDERDSNEWMNRNLNDTQYAARYFGSFIRRHLQFAEPDKEKSPVMCFSGHITALARGLWGLQKNRDEDDDLHHAQDAAVIAALTPGRIKTLTEYRKAQETGRVQEIVDFETGEVHEVVRGKRFKFPEPWKGFREEVEARLSDDPEGEIAKLNLPSYSEDPPQLRPVIVSRMPIRKLDGAIHAETIRSKRELDGKPVSVIRKRLVDLKPSDLDNLWDPKNNQKLYDAIRERMEQHGGDAKKAFAEELRKPTNSGKPGPVVRSVRLMEAQPSGIEVRGGIADNGRMVRTDVFRKKGKYYLVPVYVSHIKSGELPNKAIVAHKPESEWETIDSSFEFLFSLYPYDLVRMKVKGEEILGYYRGTHRRTGSIKLTLPNINDEEKGKSYGTRTAELMEKYFIDVLGNYYRVKREKRLGLAKHSRVESCSAEDRCRSAGDISGSRGDASS
jgi:CRISPR-associated endonuclease Csn1